MCGLSAAVIGAWAVLRPSTGPVPVASNSAPSPFPIDYDDSVQAAFERAGFATFDPQWATNPDSPIWWGRTTTDAVRRTFTYPGSPPGAEIIVTTACAGTGSVTVSWQTEHHSAEIPLSCEDEGLSETTHIETVSPDQAVEITVRGDDQVIPEGAFVVVMTDSRSLAALAALGSPPATESVVTTGTTYTSFGGGTSSRRVGPGRYRLTLICVGGAEAGQIRVRMSFGADEVSDEVACPAGGGRIELEVSGPTDDELEVSIGESGSFGYAYRIVSG